MIRWPLMNYLKRPKKTNTEEMDTGDSDIQSVSNNIEI